MTITNLEYCERMFKLALKHVRTLEDLVFMGNVIEDYEDKYKVDLIKYKREIARIRETYQKVRSYLLNKKK